MTFFVYFSMLSNKNHFFPIDYLNACFEDISLHTLSSLSDVVFCLSVLLWLLLLVFGSALYILNLTFCFICETWIFPIARVYSITISLQGRCFLIWSRPIYLILFFFFDQLQVIKDISGDNIMDVRISFSSLHFKIDLHLMYRDY